MMTTASAGEQTSGDPHKALEEFVQIPIPVLAWEQAMKLSGLALLCGVAGWMTEWIFGSWFAIPEFATGRTPPVVGVLFVMLAIVLSGAAYAAIISMGLRRVVDGRLPVHNEQTPSVAVRPVWWVRLIATSAVFWIALLVVGTVVFLGQWALHGGSWLSTANARSADSWIFVAMVIGLIGGIAALVFDAVEWILCRVVPRLMDRLKTLRAAQILLACMCGLLIGGAAFGVLVGGALLAMPFSIAAGLGSTFTLAAVATAFPPSALLAFKAANFLQDGLRVMPKTESQPRLPSQDDFRNWNVEVEASVDGKDTNGYPFYLWRESADNRLGMSRPRYCCITPGKDELYFTFFNPSEDVKASGGWIAFCVAAALVVIAMLAANWFDATPRQPYVFDKRPPPVLMLLGAAFLASIAGTIIGGLWHIFALIFRWYNNRFKSDGRHYVMPLRSLTGFNMVHAGEIGAKIKGEEAKTGHGLTAVFEDGTMVILTGNAWNYPSIVGIHRDLTNAFRVPRDAYLSEWAEKQKKSADATQSLRLSVDVTPAAPPGPSGIPHVL